MAKNEMGKFRFLTGDVCWLEYGGSWFRKVGNRYHVIVFTNMDEACGRDNEGNPRYVVELREIDVAGASAESVKQALRSCGPDSDDLAEMEPETRELCVMEAMCSYGHYAPLEDWSGDNAWKMLRSARRESNRLENDADAYEQAMDRPVNRLGSTAREYQAGDMDSAIRRGMSEGKPEAQLMGKISGVAAEPAVTFGTLQPDGTLTDIRQIKQSDMRKCPHFIMVASHYRADGSCKCDDPAEREMMIREWEYSESDFAEIPLKS